MKKKKFRVRLKLSSKGGFLILGQKFPRAAPKKEYVSVNNDDEKG